MAAKVEEEFHDFYKYTPSLPAAITFMALFSIATSLHVHQLVKSRSWLLLPLAIGGIFEIIGYAGRIWSHTQAPLFTDAPYIIQSLFLLLGPTAIAASIYMVLGRLVLLLQAEKYLFIRRTWLTKIFVGGDVLSFIVQGAGGGIMSSGEKSNLSLGENILVAGLAIQIVFLACFIITLILFYIRMRRGPTEESLTRRSNGFQWQKHLTAICLSSILIMVRSIVRFIEYVQGSGGELLNHEIYLYLFDGALILATIVLLNCQHPGAISSMPQIGGKGQSVLLGGNGGIGLSSTASQLTPGNNGGC